MEKPDLSPTRRRGVWTSLAVAAVSGVTVVTLAMPPVLAHAQPEPSPNPGIPAPPEPGAPLPPPDPFAPPPPPPDPNAPLPPPPDPNAPPPPPPDPNAPPPPPPVVDPNAPLPPPVDEPGRINNAAGSFSYVLPQGWIVGDASRLNYGDALLSKETGPAFPGQPAPVASDTSILLGRLDLRLFAGAEPDNAKAAVRLASDMGEFFMPYPGTRINQQTFALNANGLTGSASSYEVKFTDTNKPNGQIWAGVVGNAGVNAPRDQRNERWFVVWLGTGRNPIDTNAAVALANSIRPWTPPPPPPAPAPDPNAPAAAPVDPNAPPPPPGPAPIGVPVPVLTPVPEMMPQP